MSNLSHSDWVSQGAYWGIPRRAEAPELKAEPSDWRAAAGAPEA